MLRGAYPGISVAEIYWRDWKWINRNTERILRDKLHNRAFLLDVALSEAAAQNGNVEIWKELYEGCMTEQDRVEMLAERKREMLLKGGGIPKRKAPVKRNNDGAAS